MKPMTLTPIRIALFISFIASVPGSLLAQDSIPPGSGNQSNLPQQQSPGTRDRDSEGAPGMTGQMMKDRIFIRRAFAAGLAEVQFGLLAVQNAESPEVKALGQKMATDHTALNEDLKPIADQLGVMLPRKISKEDQAEYDKLRGLSGGDFDTEYLTFMVKGHHKDLREFREEAADTTDPVLKDAVTKGAAVIHEHSRMVNRLARDKGIEVPEKKRPSNES